MRRKRRYFKTGECYEGSRYAARQGMTFSIVGKLTENDGESKLLGPMYRVRFSDDVEMDVGEDSIFADEETS